MKNLAIIPARSGSKGLKDKNIKNLNGLPLMTYSIKAALESECFDEIMVSTDSMEYAKIAKKHGARVPFLRSDKLSQDNSGTWDAVREVLNMYKDIGREFEHIALLQPTSPLRDAEDIRNMFAQMQEMQADNGVSVTEVDHPIQWCFRLGNDGKMDEFAKSPYSNVRRQDLELYYRENGAIYIIDAKKIIDKNYNFYEDNCIGYVMKREKSIDIDTELDFIIAETVMKNY